MKQQKKFEHLAWINGWGPRQKVARRVSRRRQKRAWKKDWEIK